jgi:SAM-dependent methyltransferase
MHEASKTQAIRPADFTDRYLAGRVIDIGAGDDPVCPWAESFDVADGDANHVTRYRKALSYDAVHSSHCLEHMHDPEAALREWWNLLKPGGKLIVVVPDELLYEQQHWPSLFNGDHKWTFRLGSESTWSPRSIDVTALFHKLPACSILSIDLQNDNYDGLLQDDGSRKAPPVTLTRILTRLAVLGPVGLSLQRRLFRVLFRFGYAIDQTLGNALAQIQVIAEKQSVDARTQ